jgi:hypothetical protein
MCAYDDAEQVEWATSETRTARKIHRCNECRRPIIPGETYIADRYVSDGKMTMHKVCQHCGVLRSWLQAECGGWTYGGLRADFLEHFGHGPMHMDMLRLGVMARRRWWLRHSGGLYPVPPVPPSSVERVTHELLAMGPWQPADLRARTRVYDY